MARDHVIVGATMGAPSLLAAIVGVSVGVHRARRRGLSAKRLRLNVAVTAIILVFFASLAVLFALALSIIALAAVVGYAIFSTAIVIVLGTISGR